MQRPVPAQPLRVLIVAHNLTASVRHIGPVIAELLDRGHEVHMALEPPARKHSGSVWLQETSRRRGFSWGIIDTWRRDPWFLVARWLRRTGDYVSYLLMGNERAPLFAARAADRTPKAARVLVRLPLLSTRRGLRVLSRVLSALDAAVPTSRRTAAYFRQRAPDAVLLMPVLMPGSTDSAYVRAAADAGTPSVVCVPSWDNLTSKQRVRVVPSALFVWNDVQRREAQELHGIPAERVVVTGAQTFDHWFEWKARSRPAFCERVGLDPQRRYLLYAGGALYPGTITEAEFCRRWIESLRAAEDPALRDVNVLVRPHPRRLSDWEQVDFDALEGVAVWPREPLFPVGGQAEADADYYDSIFHSDAVVGINTSAMIEAAIVGRSVFTVLAPEFHSSQRGTYHFDYVLERAGGFVRTADSLEEHTLQLSAQLRGESDGLVAAGRRFVESFVRPYGVDRAATPVFADAIEHVARAGAIDPITDASWVPGWRLLLLPGFAGVQLRRVTRKLRLELGRLA